MYPFKYCLVLFDFPFTACKILSHVPIFVAAWSEWVFAELKQILILLDLQLVTGLQEGAVRISFNLLHFQVMITILFEQESRPIFLKHIMLLQ